MEKLAMQNEGWKLFSSPFGATLNAVGATHSNGITRVGWSALLAQTFTRLLQSQTNQVAEPENTP